MSGDFRFISYLTPGDVVCGLVCILILVVLKAMKTSMDFWRAPSPVEYLARQGLWLIMTARNAVVVIGATLVAFTLSITGYNFLTLVDDLQPG